MEKRTCKYCGCDISNKRKDAIHCNSKECANKRWNELYNNSLYDHICPICGERFKGPRFKINCNNCKKKRTTINYKQVVQYRHCKHCNKIISSCIKNVTTQINEHIYDGCCDDCKAIINAKRSNYMKLNNPSYTTQISIEEYTEKVKERVFYNSKEQQELRRQIARKNISQYMKQNNPMKNPDVVRKSVETRLKNKADKPFKHNKAWKGRRTLHQHIRIELRYWHKQQLANANYVCGVCGKTKCELQVHHLYPLRDIIKETLNKYNIQDGTTIDINSELCNNIVNDIKQFHDSHPEIGAVVCLDCHSKIDKHYKKRKSNNEYTTNSDKITTNSTL